MTVPPDESGNSPMPAPPSVGGGTADDPVAEWGYIPADPDEPAPVELSTSVGDVVPWGTMLLLLSWGVVSLLMAATRGLGDSAALIAHGANVPSREPLDAAWRLLASTFLHSGASHLLFNALTLLVLGQAVERVFSRWGFWIVVAYGGAAASIASLFWRWSRHPDGPGLSIGGSGVVFALGGALLSGAFRLRDRLAPTRARALAAAVLFLALPGFAEGFQKHGTDNMAHAAGLASGVVLGLGLPLTTRLGGQPANPLVRLGGAFAVAALAIAFARVLRG